MAPEERQLAAARKANATLLARQEDKPASESERGRLIFFFVDDLHLAGDSLTRARSLLSHFVEDKMTANDRVAIVATSGQIGFLQQLTDNKAVQREAIARLNYKYNPETTASQVSISEVDANLIASRGDRGLFAYLVEATMKEFQMQNPINAVNIVKNRVRQINAQSKIGLFSSFKQKLEIPREAVPAKGGRLVKWSQLLPLPPGLYQVRVAVRDRQSGRTGSGMGWIEIPRVEANPLRRP